MALHSLAHPSRPTPHSSRPTVHWFASCGCLALATLLITSAGCRRDVAEVDDPDAVEFVLGDMLEDFTPPSLEELEGKVAESGGWVEGDVLFSMKLLRERQQGETPLATVEEALALRNDSDENNEKIKSALGRLAESEDQIDYEASISRHTPQSLKNTNPLLLSSTTEFDVADLTSFGLFGFDWNFRPFAAGESVASWHTSADGMYDKVVMRDDLTWSDGKPITAHDVEFSFRVIMSEQVPIPAVRSGTDKLKMVKAYGDHTLVYFHQKPLVTNVWNVNFPVIPKHIYEDSIKDDPTLTDSNYHVEQSNSPVSGGAYTITTRTPTEVVLERRESYYMHDGKQVREKPHFETVRFDINPDGAVALLAMKAGDVDTLMLEAGQWSSQTDGEDFYSQNTKARAIEWVSFSFFWNTQTPYFSDARVRRAMGYAFDHQELLQNLRYGRDEPCTGIFHRTSRWHPGPGNAVNNVPQPLTQDRDKAKALLEAAGWTDSDGDGYRDKQVDGELVKFEFTIVTRNQKERLDVCELLKQNLRPIGIACNVRPLESATLQDKMLKKEFQATFGGWGTGADPDTSVNIWGSSEDRNYVSYANPVVDELYDQGRTLEQDRMLWKDLQVWQDEETRNYLGLEASLAEQRPTREDCYACIHGILWRDQPYTWLFYRNAYYAFNKELRGYTFSPRGPFNFGPGFSSIYRVAK